ncbi:MAG TPA: DUF3857 domain-containing protein [Terriglobales bacterium]|nr:DUF3857 domain-containing protein [Terriglobales bacterium]
MRFRFAAIVFLVSLSLAAGQERPIRAKSTKTDIAEEARTAFFVRSDLDGTLRLTDAALKGHPRNAELLFLRMEAAALEADATTTLDAALQLCSVLQPGADPLGNIASARVLDLAGNSAQFRAVIPRIRQLIAAESPYSNNLRASLIAAAAEGATGLNLLTLSREAGLLTDWRVAGPFGKLSNVAFEQAWPAEREGLTAERVAGRAVERLRFNEGTFELPEYFSREGIFYASSVVRFGENARKTLRVESDGTLEVFVDGRSVLRKDDRFRIGSQVAFADLDVGAGSHQVLVKFIPAALPFRVAFVPVRTREKQGLDGDPVETAYVAAAVDFWNGNYSDAVNRLVQLRKSHSSAAVDFLLASAWEHSSDDSPEESNYLLSCLQASSQATAAEFRLAQKAQSAGRTDEAWQRVSSIAQTHPDFAAAQQLAAEIAVAHNWTLEAISAIDAVTRLHPTCSSLEDAYRFYSAHAQFDRGSELMNRIAKCSPGNTTYIALLSESGEHENAVRAAAKVLLANPFSRQARFLEVRELALSGRDAEARDAAQELAKLAPNSTRYAELAKPDVNLIGVLEEKSDRRRDFLSNRPFYASYRRDGLKVSQENAQRNPSAPAVTLVEDKVSRLNDDHTVSVYFHRIVKILTRSGIDTFGEITLPRGAELLELRTIKQDGTIAEPEFHENKTSISMPALSPGDCIEQEYVVHYNDTKGINGHQAEFTFTFGRYHMAIASMRFVAITPESEGIVTQELNGAPKATAETKEGRRVQSWELAAVPEYVEETSLPAREVLPYVRVLTSPVAGWTSVRDCYRDALIDAVRIGPRTLAALDSLRREGTEADKLKTIYNFVASRIRSDRTVFQGEGLTSAEETLAANIGSKTAVLIAVGRAAGLQADLVLARDVSSQPPVVSQSAFTRPLVQVTMRGNPLLLDVETPNMGFGLISANLDRREALLVALTEPSSRSLISLNSPQNEQSLAEGTLRITPQGELDARVTLRLGASRSAQMRTTLANIETGGRPQFLQDLAARIFKGAQGTTGEIRNERELDRPLEIAFHCRAAGFVNVLSATASADQFVPNLGLRQLFAKAPSRRFPLYLDAPLVERTTFRVELPSNLRVARRLSTVDLRSEFGRYRLVSRELSGNSFDVTREFDIPVQVIPPGRYPDFRSFASQIEDAERQRFAFSVSGITPASSARTE